MYALASVFVLASVIVSVHLYPARANAFFFPRDDGADGDGVGFVGGVVGGGGHVGGCFDDAQGAADSGGAINSGGLVWEL